MIAALGISRYLMVSQAKSQKWFKMHVYHQPLEMPYLWRSMAPFSRIRCIQLGYEASLRPHHNFLTRNVIQAGIRAAPSREHFLSKLSQENPKENIQGFLKFYSPGLCKAHEYLLNCRLET